MKPSCSALTPQLMHWVTGSVTCLQVRTVAHLRKGTSSACQSPTLSCTRRASVSTAYAGVMGSTLSRGSQMLQCGVQAACQMQLSARLLLNSASAVPILAYWQHAVHLCQTASQNSVYNSETRQMQRKYEHIPQSRLGPTNTVQAQPVLQAVIEQ
jgi:hypothetical protein